MMAMWLGWSALGAGAAVIPQGEVERIAFDKKVEGYVLATSGLTLPVQGPTGLVLELRAPKEAKGEKVTVEIRRDGSHLSSNVIVFKKKGKAPTEYPWLQKLSLEVPEGDHTYIITASRTLAVALSLVPRAPPGILAAAETPLASAPASPAPSSEPAATAPLASDPAAVHASPAPPAPAASVAPPTSSSATASAAETSSASTPATAAPPHDIATSAFAAEAAAPRPDSDTRGMRIAVYELEREQVEPTVGAVVTDCLVAEIRKLQGVSVVGMDEIQDMLSLEATKQMVGCTEKESCLAEIAGALGVDGLVSGSLSRAADQHVMTLRRVDHTQAKVVGTFNQNLKAETGQEFLLAVGPAVERLFPDRPLRAGAARGVAEEVALRLDPPPLPTWSFWAVASTAAAAGIVGGVFGILSRSAQTQYDALERQSLVEPVAGSVLVAKGREVETNAWIANGLWIGAGALALVSGVLALFTDWEGYGEGLTEVN